MVVRCRPTSPSTYSPVRDAASQVAGVLVTAFETTEQHRAEQSIRESDRRLRALMATNSDVVYRMSANWSEMQQVDGHGVLSGTERRNSDWLREDVYPDDQPKVLAALQHCIGAKTTYRVEHRVCRADGSLGWTLFRAVPLLDENGTIQEWLGAASDITVRKQDEEQRLEAEARHSFLLQLHDRLHLLSDPVRIQFEAASALGEHLGVNRVGYAEASADGQFVNITTAYVHGLEEISGQHRLEDYGPEMLAQFGSGRTIAFDDVATDSRLTEAQKSAHELLEARADLNVPLLRSGQLRAVLFVHSRVRRVWTAGQLTLVEQIAARTWDSVERTRAELALDRRAADQTRD